MCMTWKIKVPRILLHFLFSSFLSFTHNQHNTPQQKRSLLPSPPLPSLCLKMARASPRRNSPEDNSFLPSYKSLFSSAKTKIYNYYKQATDEPAIISSYSPIWVLGTCHSLHMNDPQPIVSEPPSPKIGPAPKFDNPDDDTEWTVIQRPETPLNFEPKIVHVHVSPPPSPKVAPYNKFEENVIYSMAFDEDFSAIHSSWEAYKSGEKGPSVPPPPSSSSSPPPSSPSMSLSPSPPPLSTSPPHLQAPHEKKGQTRPRVHSNPQEERRSKAQALQQGLHGMVKRFNEDFYSRIYFSYRENFPTIPSSEFTTDCGWGCMIRSIQMMVAQALIVEFLGRDWRYREEDKIVGSLHDQILKWFVDSPNPMAHYSIQRACHVGRVVFNKKVGQWYEPTVTARIFRSMINHYRPKETTMILAKDGVVYAGDVIAECAHVSSEESRLNCSMSEINLSSNLSESPIVNSFDLRAKSIDEPNMKDEKWVPCILVIPVRLGLDHINPIYKGPIQSIFEFPQSIGIAGGRRNESMWFLAAQDDSLYYLDPHRVQPATRNIDPNSFHCKTPRKLKIDDLDPSMAIGFLIRSREDFNNFQERVAEIQKGPSPMFCVDPGRYLYTTPEEQAQDYLASQALYEFDKDYSNFY